jgi:hypothetical protein
VSFHCVLEYFASVGWLTFIIVESLSFSLSFILGGYLMFLLRFLNLGR